MAAVEDHLKQFSNLCIEGPDDHGVVQIVLDNPGRQNAMTAGMHRELAEVWPALDRQTEVRAALIRGAGAAFSAGGDFEMLAAMVDDERTRLRIYEEARTLVLNMATCSVPVVSAIRGPAVGAGLAAALLADISVATPDARLLDGHVRIGVAAGDHAVMIWPLLCGLAKAKRHLLLPDPISGAEAERIGLVSMCVPDADLDVVTQDLARRLAASSATAVRWTKRALHTWLQQAMPAFESSLALEFLGFGTGDGREGVAALREKRNPTFR